MKIAQLISSYYPTLGGAEICIHNISEKLTENGYEVIIFTNAGNNVVTPPVKYKIVYIPRMVSRLLKHLPFIGEKYFHYILKKLQKKYQFDLWQVTFGYRFGVYAVDFFNKNNIPCILRCTGGDLNKFPEINYGHRLKPKIEKLVRKKYPLYNGLVALTASVEKEYLGLGIMKEKIKIIPNGVHFKEFEKIPRSNIIRERFGAKENTNLLLTVGRHNSTKGYNLIPKIAKNLIQNGIDFIWLIVGRGHGGFDEKYPNAKELGIYTFEAELSISEDAFSLPSKSLIELYKSADIFVFPTLLETFGMVLVEAMAAGLPIITTDAPGVRDVVEHGKTGLMVPVNNANKMAEEIIKIIQNKTLKETLRQNSLDISEHFYDWGIVANKYVTFYESVIKQLK